MSVKEEFNEKRYGDWILGNGDTVRINKITQLVGSGKTVLDIGCGLGLIGNRLLEKGNKVYGIDISPTAVKKANKAGIIAKTCDIETQKIPFKNRFDTIVAAEIIEHIFDTDSFLRKIRQNLVQSGELVLTTPNLAAFGRRLLLLIGSNPHIEPNLGKYSAGHLRYYVKSTITDLLHQNSFKIVDFQSDIVNFDAQGRIYSKLLANISPTIGRSIIIRAQKLE